MHLTDTCCSPTPPTDASPATPQDGTGKPETSTDVGPHKAQVAAIPAASSVHQSTSPAPPPPALQAPTSSPGSISERIWDEAYDRLKKTESKLVDTYEKIVSENIDQSEVSTKGPPLDKNLIEQMDKNERMLQMERLVTAGMEKTKREREIKEDVGSALKGISLLNDFVGQAVSATPQGALAWMGVSLVMQVCMSTCLQNLC